ncbi:MAG TPA: hypothetical protein VMB79_16250 [Jatrophihabitans sp.]|nr:hypothetical protein [Jatrophihabitans sp.]
MSLTTQRTEMPACRRPSGWRRLNSAATVLWRAPKVIQVELGDRRITVSDVEPEQVAALLADPVRDAPDPDGAQQRAPLRGGALELAELLYGAGFLTRRGPDALPVGQLPAYLNAELNALVGRYGERGFDVLGRRRRAMVTVHGTSRVTVSIAAGLANAGVGHVHLADGGDVAAADACPGGLSPADEGRRFGISGAAAVRRSAPDVSTGPPGRSRRPDLVVLTDPAPLDPSVRDALHLDGFTHLSAFTAGSRAVVGPLVVPGRTSCLRCADLHRADRDPCWPAFAVQLARRHRHRAASEVALCLATAGLTVGQALHHLDGNRAETLDGTLEWQLPDWRLRRRSWPPHPDCDCSATASEPADGRMGP